MIFKYLKFQFISALLILLTFLSGCNTNDDINNFSQTPKERLIKAQSELKVALTSSKDGWKMIYFTDNKEFGGFTHLMNFDAEGKVKMASDFDESSVTPDISEYEIKLSYAPALVFTTRNRIHLLSDADNSPGTQNGVGYKGDFEFLFDKIDEKGDLYFKTSRSNVVIVFTKATADDWKNFGKNFDTEKAAFIGTENDAIFSVMEIKGGDKAKLYSASYDKQKRFAKFELLDPSDTLNTGYGIGLKENGIVLNPAMKIGNEQLSEFVYDSTVKAYVSKGKQGEAILKFTDQPPIAENFSLGKDVTEGKKLEFAYFPNDSSDKAGNTLFGKKTVTNVLNITNLPIHYIFLRFNIMENQKLVNKIEYNFSDGKRISHYVDIEKGENNAIILKHKEWSSKSVTKSLYILDRYLLDLKGLLLRRENYSVKYSNYLVITLKAASSLSSRKTAFALSGYSNP